MTMALLGPVMKKSVVSLMNDGKQEKEEYLLSKDVSTKQFDKFTP
jgi:predicted transposase YbfD/YdcC